MERRTSWSGVPDEGWRQRREQGQGEGHAAESTERAHAPSP